LTFILKIKCLETLIYFKTKFKIELHA
jgi:hypothetical protein